MSIMYRYKHDFDKWQTLSLNWVTGHESKLFIPLEWGYQSPVRQLFLVGHSSLLSALPHLSVLGLLLPHRSTVLTKKKKKIVV